LTTSPLFYRLIGEIVRQTGVSRDTIRYYEWLGLLQTEGRPSPFNTYKAYPAATVIRLGLIQ
jgi:MerR family copper efflux transcriptional regulator